MWDFLRREGLFTLVIIAIAIAVYFWSQSIQFSTGTKLLFVVSGGLFLIFLIVLISGAAAILTIFREKKGGQTTQEKKEGSLLSELKLEIFANVPENHIWILRNVWGSDPNTFSGYQDKKEGWRLFIPFIWHDEVKIVSLVPFQRDPKPVEINTMDNLLPLVDYRIKTWVAHHKVGDHLAIPRAATKFALRIEDRIAVEDQWAHVALNRISSGYYCSKPPNNVTGTGLTEMTRDDLKTLNEETTEEFNKEMEQFGIRGEISLQNIRPPKIIEAASSQVSVSKLSEIAAIHEAKAIETLKATGVSANVAMISKALISLTGNIFGAREEKPAGNKKEEEK